MKILREKYLDPEEKFWDYETDVIDNTSNIFSTKKTGMSFYDQLIPGSKDYEYIKKNKNLIGSIQYMSPKEYFERCSKDIFKNIPVNSLIKQRSLDKNSLNDIKTVILKYKRQLPLPFLNYAERSQEGLHRMLAVAELFGWDKKYPVLVIDYYDKDLQTRRERQKYEDDIREKVYFAVKRALRFQFESLDEFFDELQYALNESFYRRFDEPDVEFNYKIDRNFIVITVDDVEYSFDKSLIKLGSVNEAFRFREEDELSPITKKAIEKNSRQVVGNTLWNYSGSPIQRYLNKSGVRVGKSIGGKIYAHLNYINDVIPEDIIKQAFNLLKKNNLDKEVKSYNCFAYSPKDQIILFEESPDFNDEPEPRVGKIIKVDVLNNSVSKPSKPKDQIWHHKWLWVTNDYTGFDVEDSWNRSRNYCTKVLASPNGSNLKNWKQQLSDYGVDYNEI